MRARLLAPLLIPLLLVGSACTRKRIGDVASSADECETGTTVVAGRCTKYCAKQWDCPVGFDCGLATPSEAKASCYKAVYDNTIMGGFGTDCSTVSAEPGVGNPCSMAASPCAKGYGCHATVQCDPNAYCTRACKSDAECPPTMFCGQDDGSIPAAGADGGVADGGAATPGACWKRSECDDCGTDDQCPAELRCVADPAGRGHCLKACKDDTDCPQPQGGAGLFMACQPDPAGRGKFCQPGNKYCVGPSPLGAIMGNGQVCSGCRTGASNDCAMGLHCIQDKFSTERFCTADCTATFSNGKFSADTCPMGSYCYATKKSGTSVSGYCVGDPTHKSNTCYP